MARICAALLMCFALVACQHPFRAVTVSKVDVEVPPVLEGGPIRAMPLPHQPPACTKIAIVDVDGILLNMDMTGFYSLGENPVALFRERLEAIAADPCVRGVVLRINSPGGGVTATDIMWHDLLAFKARTGLPVIACLMDVATGGGYYLATAADQIMAHPTAVTGGIGVILNLYNLQDSMLQFNVMALPVKSGENIDLGSPVKAPTEEQRAILEAMAHEFHTRFRGIVTESRGGMLPGGEEVFDGRVFTANQAIELNLVDSIGYVDDALQTVRDMTGAYEARVVLYHRCNDRGRSVYAITPNAPLQSSLFPFSIPGMDRTRMPTFLYLWQPEPGMDKLGGR